MSETNSPHQSEQPKYLDPLADEALGRLAEINPDLATRLASLEKARKLAAKGDNDTLNLVSEHALAGVVYYLDKNGIGRSIEPET